MFGSDAVRDLFLCCNGEAEGVAWAFRLQIWASDFIIRAVGLFGSAVFVGPR